MLLHGRKPLIPSTNKKPEQLNDGISTATMKMVSIDEILTNAMTSSIMNAAYPNMHSVLLMRNDNLVYESCYLNKPAQEMLLRVTRTRARGL